MAVRVPTGYLFVPAEKHLPNPVEFVFFVEKIYNH